MKYLAVLVIIVLLVKIDYVLSLFDRASDRFNQNAPDVTSEEVKSSRETIPLNQDKSLKTTNKEKFLALLEDFHVSPVADIRVRAMGILKENPQMFGANLDKDLELSIYRWRELLNNNEPELVTFLIDLMNSLQGQNLETVRKFFALWMEINMENFIAAYSRTKDTNCTIATVFGDPVPEEEKLNEYYDREDALTEIINKQNINPLQKTLAQNCLLQLKLMIDKMKTPVQPSMQSSQTVPGTPP